GTGLLLQLGLEVPALLEELQALQRRGVAELRGDGLQPAPDRLRGALTAPPGTMLRQRVQVRLDGAPLGATRGHRLFVLARQLLRCHLPSPERFISPILPPRICLNRAAGRL